VDHNYQDSLDILDTTPDEDLLVEEPNVTQTETQDSNQTDPFCQLPSPACTLHLKDFARIYDPPPGNPSESMGTKEKIVMTGRSSS
jgi:hypothetical protein